ncbi:MAG: 4Fe-4S dicluster domain-containing protein [Patescibacteria group bacterium]
MDKKELENFLLQLSDRFFLFAPQREDDILKIKEVENIEDIAWSTEMPINSWKDIFLPPEERLFENVKNNLIESKTDYPPIACVGVHILDLKALTLFDQVFGPDSYYQKRRKRTILIGYSTDLSADYKKHKVFSHNFEEDILEHLAFDVFILKLKNGPLKIYSGSEKGQNILEKFSVSSYQNIEFAGPIAEKGPDKRMLLLKDKVDKSFNKKIWDELDKICLACGKCAIVCPTCFCFDFNDSANPESASRCRQWGNCFYNDFSKVAGGHKELDTVKQKIYFWYVHKFVRIPHEYNLPGCVSCNRCSQVCPVGIKISEVIKSILN